MYKRQGNNNIEDSPKSLIGDHFKPYPITITNRRSWSKKYARIKLQLDKDWTPETTFNRPHLIYWALKYEHLLQDTLDDRCLETIWDIKTRINTDSLSGSAKHIIRSQYTDGSKLSSDTGTGTGSGYVVYHKHNRIQTASHSLPAHTTIFQAELDAIYKSTRYLLDIIHRSNIKHVKILTDSQAAILALSNNNIKSKTVLDTLEGLEQVAHIINTLTVSWIKAHVGHEGNEAADLAAKEGAHTNSIFCRPIPVPWTDVKNRIEHHINCKWKANWDAIQGHKHTKFFYKGPDAIKSKGILRLSRTNLTLWIRAITGINFLANIRLMPG